MIVLKGDTMVECFIIGFILTIILVIFTIKDIVEFISIDKYIKNIYDTMSMNLKEYYDKEINKERVWK